MEEKPNTILLVGKPGSGKGTQAKLLSEDVGWIRLSSGDRIKQIRDGNEAFSPRVREMYDKGIFMPDWFADYLLESALLAVEPHVGIVCEGFGRTSSQAQHFHEIAEWLGRRILVINLEVPDEVVRERMLLRALDNSRPDSNDVEKINGRLAQYNELTAPAIEYFKKHDLLVTIDGEMTPEKIADEIKNVVQSS